MELIILVIVAIAAIGLIALLAGLREERKGSAPSEVKNIDTECCGQHAVCEKDSLLAAISREIEYFDDEELDRFRGKSPDDYSDDEEEEFRNILYTMSEDDVAGWVRSLQLRAVEIPAGLRDEVLMIVGERRASR